MKALLSIVLCLIAASLIAGAAAALAGLGAADLVAGAPGFFERPDIGPRLPLFF